MRNVISSVVFMERQGLRQERSPETEDLMLGLPREQDEEETVQTLLRPEAEEVAEVWEENMLVNVHRKQIMFSTHQHF